MLTRLADGVGWKVELLLINEEGETWAGVGAIVPLAENEALNYERI